MNISDQLFRAKIAMFLMISTCSCARPSASDSLSIRNTSPSALSTRTFTCTQKKIIAYKVNVEVEID